MKKMTIPIIAAVLIVAATAGIYFFLFQRANPALAQNEIRIGDAVFKIEIASTTIEQARGLSFRKGLEEGHGMLFLFGSGGIKNFWMKDMNFPIDIIWISGNKVAGFDENASPQPGAALWNLKVYDSPDDTDKVLEVPAGTVKKDSIAVGDVIQVGQSK